MAKRQRSTFNLLFRSIIFWFYSVVTIFIYYFFVVAAAVLPLRYRHMIIRHFLRNYLRMMKYICGINYKIEGLKNIPKDRAAIVLCKHQSAWETLLLPTVFHDPAIIVKRELLWVPFFGWGMALSGPIAINRSDKSSAMQQIITKGKKCLEQGRWIIMFPEGTRVAPGVVGQYKVGGARLAEATGYPVLPIAHNAGRFWPRRQFIKRPGTVKVVIGPLIESKGRSAQEILERTKDWIEKTMVEIDG